MFEKFNVSVQGILGGGGEYFIQVGFGWINGVVFDLLNCYLVELYSGEEFIKYVKSNGCFLKGIFFVFFNGIFVILLFLF